LEPTENTALGTDGATALEMSMDTIDPQGADNAEEVVNDPVLADQFTTSVIASQDLEPVPQSVCSPFLERTVVIKND
jgi:hypothetical protein